MKRAVVAVGSVLDLVEFPPLFCDSMPSSLHEAEVAVRYCADLVRAKFFALVAVSVCVFVDVSAA